MKAHGLLNVKQTLENRLIYGSCLNLMTHEADAKELLYNLSNSYLYKDLLNLESVRNDSFMISENVNPQSANFNRLGIYVLYYLLVLPKTSECVPVVSMRSVNSSSFCSHTNSQSGFI